MIRKLPLFTLIVLLLHLCTGFEAKAQPTYFYAGGTGNNVIPFGFAGIADKAQWLYTPAEWNTAPISGNITKVYFKVVTTTPSTTFTNLIIKLSLPGITTLPTGAVPWLPATTVYSATTTFTGVTSGNWISVQLPTPFFYPGNVPLLVDVQQGGYTVGLTIPQGAITGSQRRMYGLLVNANCTGSDNTLAPFGFDMASACTGSPSAPVITTPVQTAPVCANGTTTISATNSGAPTGIAYQWEQSANVGGPFVSVTGGTGATTLTYTTAALTTTTYYRLRATCGLNDAFSAVYTVLVGPQPPGPISGPTLVCPNQSYTWTAPAALGATSYTWTKPSGWTGTSTTNSGTFTTTSTVGAITVTATGACGTSTAQSLTTTGNVPPTQAGAITGPSQFCNGSLQQWTVPALSNVTGYQWTLPPGWTFSGSSTGNTINAISNSTPGTITVAGVNGCGTGPSSSFTVSLNAGNPVTPTAAISTAAANICSGVPTVFLANITNGGSNPGYQWKRNGNLVSSTPIYTTSSLVTGDVITLTLNSNATCASPATVNSSNSITMTVTPSVVVGININADEPNNKVCSGTPVLFTANASGTGASPTFQWYLNQNPVGTNAATYTTSALTTGDSVRCVLTSSAGCVLGPPVVSSNKVGVNVVSSVTPAVSISAVPGGQIQPLTPVTFTATSVNGGATPQYQWLKNGQVIFGANNPVYTTSGLRNGDQITVRMVSTADCAQPGYVLSNSIDVSVATGVGGLKNDYGIVMAPNPNKGGFSVGGSWDKVKTDGLELEVINALGQRVLRVVPETPVAGERIAVRMAPGTPAGVYVLRVRNAAGQLAALRFEVLDSE